MNLKMDSFEDALDRLDFDWGVDYDEQGLIDALAVALNMPYRSDIFKPSDWAGGQIQAAREAKQRRDQLMTDLGWQVGSFERGGRLVMQMRDSRGRFVTSGAANITARLREEM